MHPLFRSVRDRPASVMVGTGLALLILAVAATLTALDYDDQVRRANDQLDVMGQGIVEAVHGEIRDVGLLLLSADRADEPNATHLQGRLDVISALPFVAAVGHAPSDHAEVTWSSQVLPRSVPPIGPEMISDANNKPEIQVMYRTMGGHVLIAHPDTTTGVRVWDLVLVDMQRAAAAAIPEARTANVTWDFSPVRGAESLLTPQAAVHREYMILGSTTTWLLELRWTDRALKTLGVGVDWVTVVVGVIVAAITGVLTIRWMQRRYLAADLRATRELIEQKDLLMLAISHQMRTPLTGIIGFLRLALDEPEDRFSIQQRQELGRLALGEAELISEIVEDLILSTRIQDQQLVIVQSEVAVEGLLAQVFRASARAKETLSFTDPTRESLVIADPLRMRQLFRNIINGGRDEGATHWEVTVTTDQEMTTVALVPNVVVSPRPERLTPEQVALPEGLSTVQPRLRIARRLAEIMGGGFSVVQHKGETEIRVSLPAAWVEGPIFDQLDLVEGLGRDRSSLRHTR